MNDLATDFDEEFRTTINDALFFCYPVRDKEYQIESVSRLHALIERIQDLKEQAISSLEEDIANRLLSAEYIAQAFINELNMWISLKENKPHSSWGFLVNAQNSARAALQSHDISAHFQGHFDRFDICENLLFPPQIFLSPGTIIIESKCSICGTEYGECDHIKGRPYMGKLCSRNITKCITKEISIVSEPANKHARMLVLSNNEEVRDRLTWRVFTIEADEDLHSVYERIISEED